MEQKGY